MALQVEPPALPRRVCIQVVTTQPVVANGIESLLVGRHDDLLITVGTADGEPDVVFYDVIGLHERDGDDLEWWVAHTSSTVIAVTQDLRPDLGADAFLRGAAAAISIGASAEEFLEVVEAALTGHCADSRVAQEAEEATRAGSEVGLTHREAEVLGLIVRGLSNREICVEFHLSTNTVKSYIRSAYRKMEVLSRSEAVEWGVQHGFPLDTDLETLRGPFASPDFQPVRRASARPSKTLAGRHR